MPDNYICHKFAVDISQWWHVIQSLLQVYDCKWKAAIFFFHITTISFATNLVHINRKLARRPIFHKCEGKMTFSMLMASCDSLSCCTSLLSTERSETAHCRLVMRQLSLGHHPWLPHSWTQTALSGWVSPSYAALLNRRSFTNRLCTPASTHLISTVPT